MATSSCHSLAAVVDCASLPATEDSTGQGSKGSETGIMVLPLLTGVCRLHAKLPLPQHRVFIQLRPPAF